MSYFYGIKQEKEVLMREIRIAQVIGKMNGGGVETFVLTYQMALCKFGVYFDYIVDSDSRRVPTNQIEKFGGRVFFITPYQRIFKYCADLYRLFAKEKWDVVHCHINTLSIFPLLVAKISGVKVRISHCHGTASVWHRELVKNIIKFSLRPFAKLFATHYLACGENAARWLFGKNTDVVIINNAINSSKFLFDYCEREKVRKYYGIDKNTFVVGHIGRFVGVKNQKYIIKIAKAIFAKNNNLNIMFMLCGDGPQINEIKRHVKHAGLLKRFIFTGYITESYRIYNAFDIFILPSLYEGLGIVAIEAQQNGLYCFVSTGVPAETKVTSRMRYIDIGEENKEEWSNSIINAMKENNDRRVNIISNYNIDICAKKLFDIYNKALNNCIC